MDRRTFLETLATGARHTVRIDAVYGNPAKPMTRDAHIAKFLANAASTARPTCWR